MAEKSVRVTISKDNKTTELTLRGVTVKDFEKIFFDELDVFAENVVQNQMKSCEKRKINTTQSAVSK